MPQSLRIVRELWAHNKWNEFLPLQFNPRSNPSIAKWLLGSVSEVFEVRGFGCDSFFNKDVKKVSFCAIHSNIPFFPHFISLSYQYAATCSALWDLEISSSFKCRLRRWDEGKVEKNSRIHLHVLFTLSNNLVPIESESTSTRVDVISISRTTPDRITLYHTFSNANDMQNKWEIIDFDMENMFLGDTVEHSSQKNSSEIFVTFFTFSYDIQFHVRQCWNSSQQSDAISFPQLAVFAHIFYDSKQMYELNVLILCCTHRKFWWMRS